MNIYRCDCRDCVRYREQNGIEKTARVGCTNHPTMRLCYCKFCNKEREETRKRTLAELDLTEAIYYATKPKKRWRR